MYHKAMVLSSGIFTLTSRRKFEVIGLQNEEKAKLGIDIGGTMIKILVLKREKKACEESAPTPKASPEALVDFIVNKYNQLAKSFDIESIGIGIPGVVRDGLVSTDNLPLCDYPLQEVLGERIKAAITVDNDANCAALAEAKLGKVKYDNLVMVTIGTGIGGGIILDGKIRRARGGLGEICHMSIEATHGEPCVCGGRGCFEHYASATALVKAAEEAAKENSGSLLAKKYRENNFLNGLLIFEALSEGCETAKSVFSLYLDRLAAGLRNLAYIFDPDAIVLAGGITKDGDKFIDELTKRVGVDVPIIISELQSEAGAYGAALL